MADENTPNPSGTPSGNPSAEPDPASLPPLTTTPSTVPTGEEESTAQIARADDFDAANRSMADALSVSFKLLRVVIVVLLIVFIFSGFFTVQQNEVAVRTRFGNITETSAGSTVLTPEGGPYFAFPAPIDQVYRIPTDVQQLDINDTFWFAMAPADVGKPLDQLQPRSAQLEPDRDGSLLTRDRNLIHAQFTVSFRVPPAGAADFVRNVASVERVEAADARREAIFDRARYVVRLAVEQAVVAAAAARTVEDRARLNDDNSIRLQAQAMLDELNTGIIIEDVTVRNPTPPLQVLPAFNNLASALQGLEQATQEAQSERTRIFASAAGRPYEAMIFAIDRYEEGQRLEDAALRDAADEAINRLLARQPVSTALEPLLAALPADSERQPEGRALVEQFSQDVVGGAASQIISRAESEATQLESQFRAEAETFARNLEAYRAAPDLVRARLLADAWGAILGGNGVEAFYLPEQARKGVILDLNPDPILRQQDEEAALRAGQPQQPR